MVALEPTKKIFNDEIKAFESGLYRQVVLNIGGFRTSFAEV